MSEFSIHEQQQPQHVTKEYSATSPIEPSNLGGQDQLDVSRLSTPQPFTDITKLPLSKRVETKVKTLAQDVLSSLKENALNLVGRISGAATAVGSAIGSAYA